MTLASMSLRSAVGLAVFAAVVCAQAGPVSGQGTWEATLHARDSDGHAVSLSDAGAAYIYDSALNITWLANMNAAARSSFDDGASGIDGEMTWSSAVAWADSLTAFGGGWRLPATTDQWTAPATGPDGCTYSDVGGTDCGFNPDPASSEVAHLWYGTLGNKAYCPPGGCDELHTGQPGWGLSNTAYFQNMLDDYYWSGTEELGARRNWVWFFAAHNGEQSVTGKMLEFNAMAVRDGDVCSAFPGGGVTGGCFPGPGPFPGAVPEPSTYVLMLAGLTAVGLAAPIASRRRKAVRPELPGGQTGG